MNITISEIGLLDKVRFGVRKDSENQPEVSNEQQTLEAGMKALMFKGMNNLLSNPYLAASIKENEDAGEEKPEDKSNIAFKQAPVVANRGLKKAAKALAIGTTALILGEAVTSCKKDDDDEYMRSLLEAMANQQSDTAKVIVNVNTSTSVVVNVDMSSLDAYIARMEERDRINDQRWQEFKEWMQDWRDWAASDTQHSLTVEEYLSSLNGKADTYIDLIMRQGYDRAEADSIYRAYLERITVGLANGTTTIQGAINDLYALVNDIKDIARETLGTLKDVKASQNKLVQLTQSGNATREEVLAQGKEFRQDFKLFLEKVDVVIKKLSQLSWDQNMSTYVLANKLSMNHAELMEILEYLGVSVNDNLGQIQDKIDNNTNTLGYLAYHGIVAILDRLEKNEITLQQAKDELKAELQKIGADVEDIKNTVHEILEVAYKTYKSVNQGFYNVGLGMSQVLVNQVINNVKLDELKQEQKATRQELVKANVYLEQLLAKGDELADIIKDENHKDRETLRQSLALLGIDINMLVGKSTAEIKAEIQKATQAINKAADKIDVVIAGIEYFKNLPGYDVSSLEKALKDLGTDLKTVINNGVSTLSGNLDGVVDAINTLKAEVKAKLDEIIKKLKEVLNYCDKYEQKMDDALDLLVEIRDDGKATKENTIDLKSNSEKALAIEKNIYDTNQLILAKIGNMSPNITPEQMKEILGDYFVQVLARQNIIIDNMPTKADLEAAVTKLHNDNLETHRLLQKIYQAIDDYPEYTDQLSNLAITVICQCACGSYNNDEGIRELEDIIHGNAPSNVKAERMYVSANLAVVNMFKMGRMKMAQGKHDEAIKIFEKAGVLAPARK